MGRRITIDSASLFNKALEVIEAKELFGLKSSEIEVLIHPQSLVHAIACFCDGGMKAHIGPLICGMRLHMHCMKKRDLTYL